MYYYVASFLPFYLNDNDCLSVSQMSQENLNQ